MVDTELAIELKQELGTNEELLWAGKPKTGLVLRASDAYLIPFTAVWFGFACFWTFSAASAGAPFLFWVWGSGFMFVGFYMAVGRFFLDSAKRSKTIYGLTKDRIIIKSGILNIYVNSFNIKTISNISFSESTHKGGTIVLGSTDNRANMLQGLEWPGLVQTPRLEFIDNAREVYDMILLLQRS